MSTDATVTRDLMEVLQDSKDGFDQLAGILADEGRQDLSAAMREYARQREGFRSDLKELASHYGDHIDEDGSALAAMHRTWMSAKRALPGSDVAAAVSAGEEGEDHALEAYDSACDQALSDDLRHVVEHQRNIVKAAHDRMSELQDRLGS